MQSLGRARVLSRGQRLEYLVREPDAGNPPVRFDEREVETEHGGIVWHRQPKGPATRMAHLNHRATSRLYQPNRKVLFGLDLRPAAYRGSHPGGSPEMAIHGAPIFRRRTFASKDQSSNSRPSSEIPNTEQSKSSFPACFRARLSYLTIRAPFANGEPMKRPKKPGRKKGEQHGKHGHRLPPTLIRKLHAPIGHSITMAKR